MRMVPKMTDSPMAATPYIVPKRMPLMTTCRKMFIRCDSPAVRDRPCRRPRRRAALPGAAHDDVAVLDHVALVAELEGHVDVLLHQQHGGALLVEHLDELEDLPRQLRAQSQRGFVDHDEPGPRHEGAADGEHLLLAPAQESGLAVLAVLEHREQAVDPLERLLHRGARPRQVRAEPQVLVDGQVGEEAPALRHLHDAELDALLHAELLELLALEGDAALRPGQLPGDGLEQGALAGAVGADERDDGAFLDRERCPRKGAHVPVGDAQVPDFKQLVRQGRPRLLSRRRRRRRDTRPRSWRRSPARRRGRRSRAPRRPCARSREWRTCAPCLRRPEDVDQIVDLGRGQAGHRLVQQDEARHRGEAHGDLEEAAVGEREVLGARRRPCRRARRARGPPASAPWAPARGALPP